MSKETTVPVFANRAPWNELVLRGKRRVKTLSFNWKHRGPILLYTSSNRVDNFGWGFYPTLKRTKLGDIPRGAIVGYATVKDVMPVENFIRDFPEFYAHDNALWETLGQSYIAIVENPKRFKKPIPFTPPQGTVRISRAPASLLRRPTL